MASANERGGGGDTGRPAATNTGAANGRSTAAPRAARGARTPLNQTAAQTKVAAKDGKAPNDAARAEAAHVQPPRAERRPDALKQRREERLKAYERQRRQRMLVRIGLAVVAAIAVVVIGWSVYSKATEASPPGHRVHDTTPQSGIHIARNPDGSAPSHDPYDTDPPTSGPHFADQTSPTTWGVHTQEIENEVQVHNLEHGGIMLQYNCTCPDVVALFQKFADTKTGYPTKVISAPYTKIPKDSVAMTAWNYIWTGKPSHVNADLVRRFIKAHVDKGPEVIPSETQTLQNWESSDAAKP